MSFNIDSVAATAVTVSGIGIAIVLATMTGISFSVSPRAARGVVIALTLVAIATVLCGCSGYIRRSDMAVIRAWQQANKPAARDTVK